MNYLEKLHDIENDMEQGHWSLAAEKFRKINCSPSEFRDFLDLLTPAELEDFALLGFNTREFEGES